MKLVGQLYAPAAFTPMKNFCYSFLLEAESTPGHTAAGRIMSIKNSSGTIANQTRNLLICCAVSQPTAPPRIPYAIWDHNYSRRFGTAYSLFLQGDRISSAYATLEQI